MRHARLERISFTGTGTFLTRLLQSDLITPQDLARKYNAELHANEIMLLAYYIAAVNIETTYHALAGKTAQKDDYEPFPGIVLADTFQISEHDDTLDLDVFTANNDRIQAQLDTDISVVIGNPPYSVGQTSANDLNTNSPYPSLDRRIEETYGERSTATTRRTLYDSYVRAFRWATDRVGDVGIVGFVSNGGWIDGNTADGIRLSLADEYSHIYVYNLRGNQRTAGELSRREGGKIFGSGSRNTVAVFIGIKDPRQPGPCQIHYRDVGDYLTREQKLQIIADSTIETINWQTITPSPEGDWINQRDDDFATWPALGTRRSSSGGGTSIFKTYSLGLATNRDAWVVNYSKSALTRTVERMIQNFLEAKAEFKKFLRARVVTRADEAAANEFLAEEPAIASGTYLKWSVGLKTRLGRESDPEFDPRAVRVTAYRPFSQQYVYFDSAFNERRNQLPSIYPTPNHTNFGIVVIAPREGTEFAVLAAGPMPDLSFFTYAAQFFPRWTYQSVNDDGWALDFDPDDGVDEWAYRRVDNVTDEVLALFQKAIGSRVEKDDIFYYVYGLLHDGNYRAQYAADLKKMLPHVPAPGTLQRFQHVADIGRQLAELHVNYEEAEPYPLDVQLRAGASASSRETWRVDKMKWKSKTDHTAIIYNTVVTLTGIPDSAHEYMLGSRSALEWLIDRYQLKIDKASGIVNDPNDWCDEHDDPTYIVNLIKRITTVSVRTVELVGQLAE